MNEHFLLYYIKELGGWIVAGIILMICVLRDGSTWFQVFRDTGNTATATLIAGMQQRINSQERAIERMKDRLRDAEKRALNCERTEIELRTEIAELQHHIDYLHRDE